MDAGPSSSIPVVPELDSKPKKQLPIHNLNRIDSDESAESDNSDQSEDLPPPYKVWNDILRKLLKVLTLDVIMRTKCICFIQLFMKLFTSWLSEILKRPLWWISGVEIQVGIPPGHENHCRLRNVCCQENVYLWQFDGQTPKDRLLDISSHLMLSRGNSVQSLVLPATMYCFSFFSLLSVLSLSFRVSEMICLGVDAIHCPRATSGNELVNLFNSIAAETVTCKLGGLQDLQENQVILSGVLNVVAIRLWEIANIPGHKVKGSCSLRSSEKRRTTLSLDEKGPLIAGWVPVNLTHASRMHSDNRRGEVAGDGESLRVNNLNGASSNLMRLLFRKVVGIALGSRNNTRGCSHVLLFDVLRCWCALEDV